MGGGLMQLVAYGAQDIYLTGNPQITFFKVVYRRHTNFAMEAIEQTFNGAAKLGQKFSCTISRNGDLLSRVYLEVNMDADVSSDDFERLGHQMIDHAEIEIGGQCIDKHYGEWMDIWAQLSSTTEQWTKLKRLVDGSLQSNSKSKLYIPLQFWFCKNPGLALPLIALQYHEVKLNVQFKSRSDVKTNDAAPVTASDGTTSGSANKDREIASCCVFCDYIFLDTDERRRFAQVSHEYLIEQVQFSNSLTQANGEDQHELRFNHPVKELVWTVQSELQPFNFLAGGDTNDEVKTALLQLNGHDRFKRREGSYFRCVQPLQHHTGGHQQDESEALGGIYCYSFGLKPEEHQPSGTCNFSRIDNAVLALDANGGGTLKVYAVNYNVLRIMSGMGGLAYSN